MIGKCSTAILMGQALSRCRTRRKLTIDNLAIGAAMSPDDLRACERGERRLTASETFEIVTFLKLDVPDLFSNEGRARQADLGSPSQR